jgi:hypothetical protein
MGRYISFIVGSKGAGKSLYEARLARDLINSYYRIEKRYPQLPHRIYFSKQHFCKEIEDKELVKRRVYDAKNPAKFKDVIVNPNGHLYYWYEVDDLQFCPRVDCWRSKDPHHVHSTDIAWDEIGNDLPPDKWKDNPEWLRQIFSHSRKRGNRIFANAQKYEMTDVHFRRQVDVALMVTKLIGTRDIDPTRPDPKFVFVLQMIREFDPVDVENESDPRNLMKEGDEKMIGWPKFKFYTHKDTEVYDTTFELPPYQVHRMKEVVMQCIHGKKCKDPKSGLKIRHVPV